MRNFLVRVIANFYVLWGILLYVQAYIELVDRNYVWAAGCGLTFFGLWIVASHMYEWSAA